MQAIETTKFQAGFVVLSGSTSAIRLPSVQVHATLLFCFLFSFLFMCTLEGRGDNSVTWVLATHLQDPNEVPCFSFEPSPVWLLYALRE